MASGELKSLAGAHSECAAASTVGSKDPESSFVEIAAATTADINDAATSN